MDVGSTYPDRWDGPTSAAARTIGPIPRGKPRAAFLTADGQSATPLEQEALLGANDLVEASFLDRLMLVRDCIGQVKFQRPGGRGFATGFLIAPGILLTNHHVFPDAVSARGGGVQFDYRYDIAGQLPASTDEYDLAPDVFFHAEEALDFAAVAVAGRSTLGRAIADRGYLRLIPETGKAEFGEFVTIVQHPDGAPMRVALRENRIVRLEPDEPFLWYHADTAHGSSGAAVFNDSLQLVALHSSGRVARDELGRYRLANGGTAETLAGLGESDVIWEANVGFRISRIAPALVAAAKAGWPEHIDCIEAAIRGGDVLATRVAALTGGAKPPASSPLHEQEAQTMPDPTPAGTSLVVPLELRISLALAGGAPAGVSVTVPAPAITPAANQPQAVQLRIPVIYDGLDQRRGFDATWLDLDGAGNAPMPVLTDAGKAVAAPLLDGSGLELKYQHFSVWVQRERRLALLTAANVDWRVRPQTVDGKSTSRDALNGFPKNGNFAEQWAPDARIAPAHQLPDAFYTLDRGAFDKGHIVRRDDVCWGERWEDIQMANGDTFHVTNCSPQVNRFNQAQLGVLNWGDLEDLVQKSTKADVEKAIAYAGPILAPADRWFDGRDDGGSVRVQVPGRFWKIILVKGEVGAEAYGFVLAQDVEAITEAEFAVPAEFKPVMKPIAAIEAELRGWLDLSALAAVDQFGRVNR